MSAQQIFTPGKIRETTVSWQPLAAVLGLISLGLLLLSISAPFWLESELEAIGLEAYLASAGAIKFIAIYLWLFAVPLAVVFGATAVGVASRVSGSRIALFIFAAVASVAVPLIVGGMLGAVVPLIFGAGGVLIEIFLVLTLWFWARQRVRVTGRKRLALDLRMGGYGMFASAAWFVCGMLAMPSFGLDPATQLEIGSMGITITMAYMLLTFLTLGWGLSFASQYLSAQSEVV